jgi:hypothetical protein
VVWDATEKGDLLTWAMAAIFPKLAKSTRETVTLTDDVDQYALTSVREVSRVDLLDGDGNMMTPLPGGSWELWGDTYQASPTLYVSTRFAKTGWSLRVHGYAPYDLSSSLPPDAFVPLILAIARSEALRRMIGDRAKFEQWMAENQTQNVTVNELVLLVNEADAERARLQREIKVWRKPVPGRV